jgi:hypothetical protein
MMKIIMAIWGLFLAASLAGADSIGLTVAVQGKATATDASSAVRELAIKSEIQLNDSIKTGEKSRVQIMLNDDTLLAVGASSEMAIDEYVYSPAKASDNSFGVKMGKGVFRTVTGAITDLNPDRFKVKTRRATIGIRGCDLGFDTTDEDEDRVSVLAIPKGKKILITAVESGKQLTVEVPTFVTINSRGGIAQRDLTSADYKNTQQVTTPQAGTPSVNDLGAIGQDVGLLTQKEFTPIVDNNVIQSTAQESEGTQP